MCGRPGVKELHNILLKLAGSRLAAGFEKSFLKPTLQSGTVQALPSARRFINVPTTPAAASPLQPTL
jgi:hypothetical protein